jgi:hypothetical protein
VVLDRPSGHDRHDPALLTASLACDADSQSTTSFTSGGTVSDSEVLSLDIISISGNPRSMRLHVQSRGND